MLSYVLPGTYVDLNGWSQATLEFRSALHELVNNCKTRHVSLKFEATKGDWCINPSHIKMLPDVGLVKASKVCVLKPANVDWVDALSRYTPPCSWTFSTSWLFRAATSGIRDTVHHPYISTWFCGKHFHSPYTCYLRIAYPAHTLGTCRYVFASTHARRACLMSTSCRYA